MLGLELVTLYLKQFHAYVYGCFSFCLLICRSNILFNRTNIFRDKTSFRQFLTWLLPGLKKMLILIISNKICNGNNLEIIKINIFFRPGRSHVRNWRKLVLSLKILVPCLFYTFLASHHSESA